MTYRSNLKEAAFWHGRVCLACGEGWDEDEYGGAYPDLECPGCGEEALIDARALASWLGVVDGQGDG